MLTRSDRPLVWAHRGASAQAPENTLAAFELAARQGADGVELDVQRCGSGEVVVLHDETLARTTGFVGLLRETPWEVVRRLDAGARFSPAFAGQRVPLLAEVLLQTPPTLLVNVELKCEGLDDRGLTAETLRVIADAGASERVLLSSFNPACLWRAKALSPRLPRALLFERDSAWPLRRAVVAQPLGAVALHPEAELATDGSLRRWRRRGYAVAVWTVDDAARARDLWRAGATSVITNRPDALLAAFR